METIIRKVLPPGRDPDENFGNVRHIASDEPVQHVVIDRIHIPFWNLVGFLIKLSFATIPAALIILLAYAICAGFLASFMATLRP